jgi:myo-inositol-1(or 4)-monophosphatase
MDRFIKDIVREAGALAHRRFKGAKAKYYKSESRGDAVTAVDLASEKLIMSRIKKNYPEHGIISEEAGRSNENADYVWIIDPIDGTLNFASGVPIFGVMVTLAHKKQLLLAAVYLPMTDELIFAKRGKGAFINGKRVHCSKTTNLLKSHGFVNASLRKPGITRFLADLYKNFEGGNAMIHAFGCAAFNCRQVALGMSDWIAAQSGMLHDFAPLALILKEAGCTVTGSDGKEWTMESPGIVAANPRLHAKLLPLVLRAAKK